MKENYTQDSATKSMTRATWFAALAAFLSFLSSIATVVILISQDRVMKEQANSMKEQIEVAFTSVRYNKQLELTADLQDDIYSFFSIAYWVPYFARLDQKGNDPQSVRYLNDHLNELKTTSLQIEKMAGRLRVVFPNQVAELALLISYYIRAQVSDYEKIIKQNDATSTKIIESVESRDWFFKSDDINYFHNSPYILGLFKCFEKTIGFGHVIDQKTVTICQLGQWLSEK